MSEENGHRNNGQNGKKPKSNADKKTEGRRKPPAPGETDWNGDYGLEHDGSHPKGKEPDENGNFKPGRVEGDKSPSTEEQDAKRDMYPTALETKSMRIFRLPLLPLSGEHEFDELSPEERVFDSLIELSRKLLAMGMSVAEVDRAILTHDQVHKPLRGRRITGAERGEIVRCARIRNVSVLDMSPEEHLANSVSFWSSHMRRASQTHQKAESEIEKREALIDDWDEKLHRVDPENAKAIEAILNAKGQDIRHLSFAKSDLRNAMSMMLHCRNKMDTLLPVTQKHVETYQHHTRNADGSETTTTISVTSEPVSDEDEQRQLEAMLLELKENSGVDFDVIDVELGDGEGD